MPPPNAMQSLFTQGEDWSGMVTPDSAPDGLGAALEAARTAVELAKTGFP